VTDGARAKKELFDVLDDLETLLKHPDLTAELAASRVNSSLALVAAMGLRAYLSGDRAAAIEDLSTAAEEIAARGAIDE